MSRTRVAALLLTVGALSVAPVAHAEPPPGGWSAPPSVVRCQPGVPAQTPIDPCAWRRGRRLSLTGIFLGYAGVGLAASGLTLTVSGRGDQGPLSDRDLFVATTVSGAGLGVLGVSLQLAGSRMQVRATLPEERGGLGLRTLAAGLGVVGIVSAGLVSWRLLEPEPDGLWLPIGGGLAAVGLLGASGLHTVALLEEDERGRRARVWTWAQLQIHPRGVRIVGQF